MKKVLTLSMSVLVSLPLVLSGCSKENGDKPQQSPASDSSGTAGKTGDGDKSELKPGELPLANKTTELRIATTDNYYAPKSYAQNLPVFQEIEKRTNVKIKWEVAPAAQAQTVLDTMFAAGNNLPDIVWGGVDTRKYFNAGLIHDLKPFIEQFAPNIQKLFKEKPIVEALITEPSGEILSLPQVAFDEDFLPTYLIRQDWLNKVGKQVPKTIDELVDVLKAFRDNDPNGNNQKDEIPLLIPPGFRDFLAGSFDVHPRNNFYPNEAGKIEFVPITEKYRTYLKFLNMLYKEKLLDPSFAAQTNDKVTTMINGNIAGVVVHYMANINSFGKDKWTGFIYPKGPEGKQFAERNAPISVPAVITKQSANPQLAIKYLDYIMASDDGKMFANYGLEGVTYKMDNGKPVYVDSVLNPAKDNPDPLRAIGALWNLPKVQMFEATNQFVGEKVAKLNAEMKTIMVDSYPASYIPMTKEEADQFNKGWVDMDTFKEEMVTKFILGSADLDKDWNGFVDKMKQLGIDQKIAIEQGKYERYKKIVEKKK